MKKRVFMLIKLSFFAFTCMLICNNTVKADGRKKIQLNINTYYNEDNDIENSNEDNDIENSNEDNDIENNSEDQEKLIEFKVYDENRITSESSFTFDIDSFYETTKDLACDIIPEKVTFSNPKMAEWKKGSRTVKVKKNGTCTMNITYKGVTVSATLTFTKPKYYLKTNKVKLTSGKTKKIYIMRKDIKGNFSYEMKKCKSSNKKIVSAIDDDDCVLLKAKDSGTCTVTITMGTGQELKFKVTVPKLTLKQRLAIQPYEIHVSNYKYNYMDYSYYADITLSTEIEKNEELIEFCLYEYDGYGNILNRGTWYYNGDIRVYITSLCKLVSNTTKCRVCVKKVTYTDGRTWSNPCYSDWSKKYYWNY